MYETGNSNGKKPVVAAFYSLKAVSSMAFKHGYENQSNSHWLEKKEEKSRFLHWREERLNISILFLEF